MPLQRFDVIRGRSDAALRAVLDAAHEALVEAFKVPASERYQCVTQHGPGELVVGDSGLGYQRTDKLVLLSVVTRMRTTTEKVAFYRALVRNLQARCGIAPDDVVVSVVENNHADWSFGRGRAQYLTHEVRHVDSD